MDSYLRHFQILTSEVMITFCYYLEKLSYGSFILFWVAIKVDRGLLPYATFALEVLIFVLLFSVINEVIKEKIGDLLEVLYNQPWYELPPAQRRMLVPLIVDLQRSVGISTGLEDLTLEWYARLIKAAYSSGLVLEELIKN